MRKSRILTFLFALWPGAGQMYLGYTKRGVSLMTGFLLLIGMSNFLNLWIFATFTPVVWFYAFFDAWSIRNMDPAKLEHIAGYPLHGQPSAVQFIEIFSNYIQRNCLKEPARTR